MSWDFETEPEFQRELNWVDEFVREEVEPLDLVLGSPYDLSDPRVRKATKPLQDEVKKRGLWACHLGPDLGGPGYGQLKLALLNGSFEVRPPGLPAARRPTRATRRSWRTTGVQSRRSASCSRSWTGRSSPATR